MRLLGWSVLLVLLVVQVWGLYAPSSPGPEGPPGSDKVAHLLGFGIPAALAWWLSARGVVALLLVHALASEPLQQAVAPERMLDWVDTVANLLGTGLGVALAAAARRFTGHHGGTPTTGQEAR